MGNLNVCLQARTYGDSGQPQTHVNSEHLHVNWCVVYCGAVLGLGAYCLLMCGQKFD